jgi:hypothetical protein
MRPGLRLTPSRPRIGPGLTPVRLMIRATSHPAEANHLGAERTIEKEYRGHLDREGEGNARSPQSGRPPLRRMIGHGGEASPIRIVPGRQPGAARSSVMATDPQPSHHQAGPQPILIPKSLTTHPMAMNDGGRSRAHDVSGSGLLLRVKSAADVEIRLRVNSTLDATIRPVNSLKSETADSVPTADESPGEDARVCDSRPS